MTPLARLILAVALALALLLAYDRHRIDAENFALGTENQAAFESWGGQRITASTPRDIIDLVAAHAGTAASASGTAAGPDRILWLGNSQLHTINQFKAGDHLAPYWLAERSACGGCLLPLGLSLPNASLQEHLLLAHMVTTRLSISGVVLKLVFDDLREDGLRDDLEPMLSADVRQALRRSDIGQEMLRSWDGRAKAGVTADKTKALDGFAQKYLEDRLVDGLAALVPLWADRANLRSRLLTDLYETRNRAFGITPSSVRRIIRPRLERNMRALAALVEHLRAAAIPLLVYIAPIRQDVTLPYDVGAYRAWISGIERMGRELGFRFVNLERLVPDQEWGSIHHGEVDFMHFQGSGHKQLAAALWPEVEHLVRDKLAVMP